MAEIYLRLHVIYVRPFLCVPGWMFLNLGTFTFFQHQTTWPKQPLAALKSVVNPSNCLYPKKVKLFGVGCSIRFQKHTAHWKLLLYRQRGQELANFDRAPRRFPGAWTKNWDIFSSSSINFFCTRPVSSAKIELFSPCLFISKIYSMGAFVYQQKRKLNLMSNFTLYCLPTL